jgi:hypothetical protein
MTWPNLKRIGKWRLVFIRSMPGAKPKIGDFRLKFRFIACSLGKLGAKAA